MNWKASPPAVETAAAMLSVTGLGGAICFAVVRIAPFGAGWVAAGVAGGCAALTGAALLARIDRQLPARPMDPPVLVPNDPALVEDVLLLEDRVEDWPAAPAPIAEAPRVVRLFAAAPAEEEAPLPLVGPSEMIARIEDFLGHSRGMAAAAAPARDAPALASDANAALHAALADIRRSLRQG